jgi:hypothetical protein
MTECNICGKQGTAYAQVFQGRKKIGSYPLCVEHALWVYGFQQIAQNGARTGIAKALGMKKGSLPRVQVGLVP